MHRHLKIVCHPHESLRWVFDGKPRLRLEKPNDWTTDQVVDPTPCYPHDIKVVRETLDRCTQAFTPLSRIWIHLLSFELESRTNGHAERSWESRLGEEQEALRRCHRPAREADPSASCNDQVPGCS